MSPRPAATRHDPAALQFLNAAAQLIDSSLAAGEHPLARRVTSLRSPASLEWMRIEDVVAVARHTQSPTASKKALVNRWSTRDEFVRDAVIHTMLYRDRPEEDVLAAGPSLDHLRQAESVSTGIIRMVDGLVEEMLRHPRTYLLVHIAPLLPRHPELAARVIEGTRATELAWMSQYPAVLAELGCRFRPEWTPSRVTLSLQMLLDGFIVRSRVDPEAVTAARWESASLFADTIIALLIGILDLPRTAQPARVWFDSQITVRGTPT